MHEYPPYDLTGLPSVEEMCDIMNQVMKKIGRHAIVWELREPGTEPGDGGIARSPYHYSARVLRENPFGMQLVPFVVEVSTVRTVTSSQKGFDSYAEAWREEIKYLQPEFDPQQ